MTADALDTPESAPRQTSLADLVRESPGIVPGLALVGLIVVWSYRDGGYPVDEWSPGALFVVALVLASLIALPTRFPPRAILAASGCLGAYTAWSYLTIAWADVRADAWIGANRTFLYFTVFILVAWWSWRPVAATILLAAYALGIWGVAILTFKDIVDRADVMGVFTEGRLAAPISYANGNCALFIMAALPALLIASRREAPGLLRGAFLAVAGTLVQMLILTQSRASLVFGPLAIILFLVLVPSRLRSVLALVLVTAVVAPTVPRFLDVYEVVLGNEPTGPTLRSAQWALLATIVVLFALGMVWGAIDGRVAAPARLTRALGLALVAIAVAVVVLGVGAALTRFPHPESALSAAWSHFRSEQYVTDPGTPHFTSGFGSGRYKLWVVAVREFRDHPLTGVGVDNFATDYLRERVDQSQPLYPHSVILRTLAQTGLVGAVLLLGFFGFAAFACWRPLRAADASVRAVAGVGGAVVGYWLAHGSIDWFWEIPALAAPAFAFLALSARVTVGPAPGAPMRRGWAVLLPVAVGLAALAPAASVALPWLAQREVDAAAAGWRGDADAAYERLARARSLDRLSDEPDVVEALIAGSLGQPAREEAALRRALVRDPKNWYPMVQLAALETRRHRPKHALDWLARAERLNPREPTIAFIRQQIGLGKPVSNATLNRMFVEQVDLITGTRQKN